MAFLFWFHRVQKNLPALGGRELKYTPGWAVGGFFVPFLNLVRPIQVMREVWHGSDPSGLERDGAPDGPMIRNQLGTPWLVSWWWILFIVSHLVGRVFMRTRLTPDQSIEQLQATYTYLVISNVLDLPSALVAMLLVARVTRLQRRRSDRIRQSA